MNLKIKISAYEFFPIMLLMSLTILAFALQTYYSLIAGTVLHTIYAFRTFLGLNSNKKKLIKFSLSLLLFLPGFINPDEIYEKTFYFLATLAAFFAAMSISSKSPLLLLKAISWIYWIFVIIIFYFLCINFGYSEPLGQIIEGSSANGITSYLIVLQLSLSLTYFLVHYRLPIFSPMVTFLVAIYGLGRGSMTVSILIFLLTLICNTFLIRRNKLSFLWVCIIMLLLILTLFDGELIKFIYGYTKLNAGLVDLNRLRILYDYMDSLNIFTLFVGCPSCSAEASHLYNNNPHISFIRTHEFFGLPMTSLALLSPLIILMIRRALKDKLIFFIFISLAIMRAFSEPIFFPTLLDFFYFYIFFIYIKHAKHSRKNRFSILQSGMNHA